MKLNQSIALDFVKDKIQQIPVIKELKEKNYQNEKYNIEISFNNNEKVFIEVKVFNEIFPRDIKKIVDYKLFENEEIYYVIVAPYISEKVHKICEENSIGYFDYSGNCLFYTNSVYMQKVGYPNLYKSPMNKNDIFNPKAIISSKILRVIAQNIEIPFKLKTLSEIVGCSIGQVFKVKDALYSKTIAEFDRAGLIITDGKLLMKEWAEEFARKEKEEILCYSLDSLNEIERKLALMKQTEGINYYLTGIAGGVRYAPVVRYNKIQVYIPTTEIKKALQFLGCKEVSSGANVIIYPLDETIYTYDCKIINGESVVSPVQAYLDCMQIKGRGEEIANEILRKEIVKD